MSLLTYFSKESDLPDPSGLLARFIPKSSILAANSKGLVWFYQTAIMKKINHKMFNIAEAQMFCPPPPRKLPAIEYSKTSQIKL